MNTKHVVWGAVALVAVSGAWVARAAWRAHRNLVTLHVRNVPVAEVVRKIESQTHEKISFDKKLDGLVTLDLKDKPLTIVLDRLAEQAGARWSTVYAVYESKSALAGLESALHGDRKMDEAGWKTIAPAGLTGSDLDLKDLPEGVQRMISTNLGGPDGAHAGVGPVRMVVTAGGPRGSGGGQVMSEDVQVRSGQGPRRMVITSDDGADDAGTNRTGGMVKSPKLQATPVVRVMRARAGANGVVEEDIWSPEELVLEARLAPRLTGDFSAAATPEAADEAARTVKGRWKTYYSLRKSPIGLAGMPMMGAKFRRGPMGPEGKGAPGGTNGPMVTAHGGMDIEGAFRAQRLDELGKLTPEQRVQRARERQASKGVIQRVTN